MLIVKKNSQKLQFKTRLMRNGLASSTHSSPEIAFIIDDKGPTRTGRVRVSNFIIRILLINEYPEMRIYDD